MTPRRPSLPSTISRTLGPVEVWGTGRVTSSPAGVTTRTAAREVGDVAVAVGLHARGARGDPAAERRVGEAVGEVAERPSLRVELALDVRAERAGLDAGEAGGRVDGEHSRSRVTSSEMTVRCSCVGASRLPEMLVPPPNGMSTASASRAARMTAATSSSSAGPDDDVREPAEIAATVADEIAQALAAGVDDAVERIGGDVADRGLERGGQIRGQRRLGDLQGVEARSAGRPRG